MGNPHPHLVVVPLSTLTNWERELAKWAPRMYTVCLKGNADARRTIRKFDAHLDGGGRKRREQPVRFSVMLTTYEVTQQARASSATCDKECACVRAPACMC